MATTYPLLDGIDSPADLRALPEERLPAVAAELRRFLIESVARTGGHLASGLGAVELTLALHYAFQTPEDQVVWDVGHQCYPHKILTGRRGLFHSLRQADGLSGFCRREESPYDCFNAGHASTSISAALGLAVARDAHGGRERVVAVIGDGALTGGLAMEGLNQAGYLRRDLIVVLNDNEMSISPNVGAMQGYLGRILAGQPYRQFKGDVQQLLRHIPRVGEPMLRAAAKLEHAAKQLAVPGMLFEELGFTYVGPVDGHDCAALLEALRRYRGHRGPVLLHVKTVKGKGYRPAERNPAFWHGTGPFAAATGEVNGGSGPPSYTEVFSATMLELAAADERVHAISAAMPEGTGLAAFAAHFPERFADVGICEEHAVTFAAGMAAGGLRPVVAVYSTFLQRAYDQIFHDVCLMRLPVVLAMDRAGLVGDDGPTHHGVFDLSYLRSLPELVLMAPRDEDQLRHMLATALALDGPSALRYPRGAGFGVALDGPPRPLPLGRGELLREGADGAIWAAGTMATQAVRAAEQLAAGGGPDLTVVDARFVKPLDRELLLATVPDGGRLLTVEENALAGGFGAAVLEELEQAGRTGVAVARLGIPDAFQPHGRQADLRARLGLDADGIARRAAEHFRRRRLGVAS